MFAQICEISGASGCRQVICTGFKENLFPKEILFFEVINVTKVYHWVVVIIQGTTNLSHTDSASDRAERGNVLVLLRSLQ